MGHNRPLIRVLCFYRYWARERGSTREFNDGVMIAVERLENVYESFAAKMRSQINRWGCYWIGPRPNAYELSGFIAENGTMKRVKAEPSPQTDED